MNNLKKYEKDEEISGVLEYFEKYPLQNPVYKIFFNFHTLVNNNLFNNANILLTPRDGIEVRWEATEKVRMSTVDYLAFLHEAYKEDEVFLN